MISATCINSGDWPEKAQKGVRALPDKSASRGEQRETHTYSSEPIGQIIEIWLRQNYPPTSGESTSRIYRKILFSLRAYLQALGLDLNSPGDQLIQLVQTWADSRASTSKRPGSVAPATYNQRIAAINSFYSWINDNQIADWTNPTKALNRPTIKKYKEAQALDVQQVRRQ